MQATLIKIAVNPAAVNPDKSGAPIEYPGWIVPDTEGLLAIDERRPACVETCESAVWVITHLPTGYRITTGLYTDAPTRARAIQIAQAFYREMKALGCDLTSSDPQAIVAPVEKLSSEGRRDFWHKIAGWVRAAKAVEAKVDELSGAQSEGGDA